MSLHIPWFWAAFRVKNIKTKGKKTLIFLKPRWYTIKLNGFPNKMGLQSSWGYWSESPCLFCSAQRSGNIHGGCRKAVTNLFPERESLCWSFCMLWKGLVNPGPCVVSPASELMWRFSTGKRRGHARATAQAVHEKQMGSGRKEEQEWSMRRREKKESETRVGNFIREDCGGVTVTIPGGICLST